MAVLRTAWRTVLWRSLRIRTAFKPSAWTSITHTRPVHAGDTLTATATERNRSARFATYEVCVTDQRERIVALFKGTVFRTGENWAV